MAYHDDEPLIELQPVQLQLDHESQALMSKLKTIHGTHKALTNKIQSAVRTVTDRAQRVTMDGIVGPEGWHNRLFTEEEKAADIHTLPFKEATICDDDGINKKILTTGNLVVTCNRVILLCVAGGSKNSVSADNPIILPGGYNVKSVKLERSTFITHPLSAVRSVEFDFMSSVESTSFVQGEHGCCPDVNGVNDRWFLNLCCCAWICPKEWKDTGVDIKKTDTRSIKLIYHVYPLRKLNIMNVSLHQGASFESALRMIHLLQRAIHNHPIDKV